MTFFSLLVLVVKECSEVGQVPTGRFHRGENVDSGTRPPIITFDG